MKHERPDKLPIANRRGTGQDVRPSGPGVGARLEQQRPLHGKDGGVSLAVGAAGTAAAASKESKPAATPPAAGRDGSNGALTCSPRQPSAIQQTYEVLGGTDSPDSGTPRSPHSNATGSVAGQSAGSRAFSASALGDLRSVSERVTERRPVQRGPSGLRQDSVTESIATMTTTATGESSANASPRRSSNHDGVPPLPHNIRAMAGVAVSGEPPDSVLGWRSRAAAAAAAGGTATGSFSVDGTSDAGASSVVGGAARSSFDSRRNMSLQQLQKAIKSIMVSDAEMYAKLQAGLQGIGSLARETHQLMVNRDETGATCINQYVVVKTLGRGSYGKVKLCLNTLDGQLYAIKMMNRSFLLRTLRRPKAALRKGSRASVSAEAAPSTAPGDTPAVAAAAAAAIVPDSADEVSKEIAILKKLDHPNVVKLFEVIDPPGSQYMMLVMEYLEKGPVLQTRDQAGFDRLPEEVAADFFRQAMKGLEYLHYHRVVHGDIKPENLLVSSNGELKISDFGCSRMADGKTAQQRLSGTPAFTAPELVAGAHGNPFAADVWAMGACLYCMLYGQLPFQGGSVLDIFKAITTAPLELPDSVPISPDLKDLLHRLFDKDPATRITVPEIMCHPWVTDRGQLVLSQLGGPGGAPSGFGTIEVTAQEQRGAIDRASLVSMIRARLKEKTFRPGEYLIKQGQANNCVYFVMSGAVEVLGQADPDTFGGSFGSREHSFTIDIDESLTLDCANLHAGALTAPQGAINGRLHIDRFKARDMRMRHRSWMDATAAGTDVVVEIKGPGQVVGEVVMEDVPPPCRYGARARGNVVALKLTQENYLRALAAMYFEAESGARGGASSGGGALGVPTISSCGGAAPSAAPTAPLATAGSGSAALPQPFEGYGGSGGFRIGSGPGGGDFGLGLSPVASSGGLNRSGRMLGDDQPTSGDETAGEASLPLPKAFGLPPVGEAAADAEQQHRQQQRQQ